MPKKVKDKKIKNTISIIAVPDKGLLQRQPEVSELPLDDLKKNLNEFITQFNTVFAGIPTNMKNYNVESISVSVGVSMDASVKFLGIGADVGANASLTINFTNKK